jgi:hypothetical protein
MARSLVHWFRSPDSFIHVIPQFDEVFGTTAVVQIVDSVRLCTQAGESAGVGDVGAGLGTATATAATAAASTTFATTTSIATIATAASTAELATAFTAATVLTTTATLAAAEVATTLATATAAASSSGWSTLTGRGSKHAVGIELDVNLLLALTFALGLAPWASHEVVLLLTGQRLALGELGAAALVGLAHVLGRRQLLLGLLEQIFGVRLALVLGFGLRLGLGDSVLVDGLLLFGLGDGLSGLLVFQLGLAVVAAPAVSSLLLVLTVTVSTSQSE